MKTFFGRVPTEFLDMSGDYFYASNGTAYYYKATLNLEEEHVYLEDTCGRCVPMDLETIRDAAMALTMLSKRIKAQETAEKAYNEVINDYMNEISQNTEDWNDLRA
jgi:hypothetical protein